jgi:hypothetical protein
MMSSVAVMVMEQTVQLHVAHFEHDHSEAQHSQNRCFVKPRDQRCHPGDWNFVQNL